MRKIQFTNEEHYHVFNRGVDKRTVVQDEEDMKRFIQSMEEFNVLDPIGSIYENSLRKRDPLGSLASKGKEKTRMVDFICYCINPNHYHFLVKQVVDKGVEKFMHRFGTGYTKFFNQKYNRSGALFQGSYKAVPIDSNEYLLHVSAYINLNNRVHHLGSGSLASKMSWEEYTGKVDDAFCEKGIVLDQFKNKNDYRKFAEASLEDIIARKDMEKVRLE